MIEGIRIKIRPVWPCQGTRHRIEVNPTEKIRILQRAIQFTFQHRFEIHRLLFSVRKDDRQVVKCLNLEADNSGKGVRYVPIIAGVLLKRAGHPIARFPSQPAIPAGGSPPRSISKNYNSPVPIFSPYCHCLPQHVSLNFRLVKSTLSVVCSAKGRPTRQWLLG